MIGMLQAAARGLMGAFLVSFWSRPTVHDSPLPVIVIILMATNITWLDSWTQFLDMGPSHWRPMGLVTSLALFVGCTAVTVAMAAVLKTGLNLGLCFMQTACASVAMWILMSSLILNRVARLPAPPTVAPRKTEAPNKAL